MLRFINIGISVISGPILIFILAYALNGDKYNEFNKIYYASSLLSTLGTFGLDFATSKIKTNKYTTLAAVSINSFVFSPLLVAFSSNAYALPSLLLIVLSSIFNSSATIYLTNILFDNNTTKYMLYTVGRGVIQLLLIPMLLLTNLPAVIPYFIVMFMGLLVCFPYTTKFTDNNITQTKLIYKLGFSNLLINSIASALLTADKYVANNFFSVSQANAYTFAWSFIAPLFYIGNTFEKYIYASLISSKKSFFTKTGSLLILLVSVYIIVICLIANLNLLILPKHLDQKQFYHFIYLMLAGYSIFTIIHFPLNAYVFKLSDEAGISRLARLNLVLVIMSMFVFLLLNHYKLLYDYKIMLSFVWSVLLAYLMIKLIYSYNNIISNNYKSV